jgi:hypothetical protein
VLTKPLQSFSLRSEVAVLDRCSDSTGHRLVKVRKVETKRHYLLFFAQCSRYLKRRRYFRPVILPKRRLTPQTLAAADQVLGLPRLVRKREQVLGAPRLAVELGHGVVMCVVSMVLVGVRGFGQARRLR